MTPRQWLAWETGSVEFAPISTGRMGKTVEEGQFREEEEMRHWFFPGKLTAYEIYLSGDGI